MDGGMFEYHLRTFAMVQPCPSEGCGGFIEPDSNSCSECTQDVFSCSGCRKLNLTTQRTCSECGMNPDDEPTYPYASLTPNPPMDTDELVHISESPSGTGRRYFCPECGQAFISSHREGLVFFRHKGENGSWRDEPPGWNCETSWDHVRKQDSTGWWYNDIHAALEGRNVQTKSRQEIWSEREAGLPFHVELQYHQRRRSYIPFLMRNISEEEDSRSIEFPDLGSFEHGYLALPDLNGEVRCCVNGEERLVQLNFLRVCISEEEKRGTLAHGIYRFDALHGSIYEQVEGEDGDIRILDSWYRRRTHRRSTELAIPSIQGTIPFLDELSFVPLVHVDGGDVITERVIYRLETRDIEPFPLYSNDVSLNVAAVRSAEHFRPTVRVFREGSASTISLYRTHDLEMPTVGSVQLDACNRVGSGNATLRIELTDVPTTLSIAMPDDQRIDLSGCPATANGIESSSGTWINTIHGTLHAVLHQLQLTRPCAFSVRINTNSSHNFDDILVFKPYDEGSLLSLEYNAGTAHLNSEPEHLDDGHFLDGHSEDERPQEHCSDAPKLSPNPRRRRRLKTSNRAIFFGHIGVEHRAPRSVKRSLARLLKMDVSGIEDLSLTEEFIRIKNWIEEIGGATEAILPAIIHCRRVDDE
jgi:hypothetical protein